ncbi:hypothetical protein BKA67DRAFT_529756 [Truncatella angustata]|uniref:Uncharacterized protein n=1 Tax=Truncatella angustata TaxID=152316 RepID=A0A9P9A2N7_9PEZI|nr:uncharacterized protein BKA67DRAFT_529756 [Truncatella angustata]KAH6659612.1 hypothetical protein BKA67DRAFT_529756 [Truncatella angustata]
MTKTLPTSIVRLPNIVLQRQPTMGAGTMMGCAGSQQAQKDLITARCPPSNEIDSIWQSGEPTIHGQGTAVLELFKSPTDVTWAGDGCRSTFMLGATTMGLAGLQSLRAPI